jgi:hypothetical protein
MSDNRGASPFPPSAFTGDGKVLLPRRLRPEHPIEIDMFFDFMLDDRPMRRVVIESPLSPSNGHSFESNQDYARRCMKDSLDRGEAPYASHLLYTQMLDDFDPVERKLGMEAGFAWGQAANTIAVYTDRGMSSGMIEGIKRAHARGATIVFRSIGDGA